MYKRAKHEGYTLSMILRYGPSEGSRVKILLAVFVFSSLIPFPLAAQTAEEIIRRSEDRIKGTTCSGSFVMTVVTPDYTRRMEMESWWVGNEKALIVIRAPKKEAGNKTLKIGNEMWMYLKNTETTIKIPPSMMLQSWNGSDFTNDDLVRESNLVEDYIHEMAGEETADGEACWKIRLTPKSSTAVVWGKLVYLVRKKDYLPARVEYYDEKGKLMRELRFSDVKTMGGRTIPTKWTMVNRVKPGHRTEFQITRIAFDIRIKDKIFSFQELERGS
ncbi:MAG: outer membrane lipoprotein-sorting protein [Bacteroidota bacterium]|nr:outer membrane lipoprotein-sorting protein [Bacteroidota bacterium]